MHQGYTLNDDKARFSNKVVMHSLYPEKFKLSQDFGGSSWLGSKWAQMDSK